MFNHIRKVPYVASDSKGGVSYFSGGFQNQFGLETQIVAAICKFLPSIHPATGDLGSVLTIYKRRHPLLRNHQLGPQSPPHDEPALAANCSFRLGSGDSWHVQLFAQRFQDKEWWLPLLAASVLEGMKEVYGS